MGDPSQGNGMNQNSTRTTTDGRRYVSAREECGSELEPTVWTIGNLASFFEMSNEELLETGLVFEAGKCVQNDGTETPAIWKYYFKHTRKEDLDYVGAYLQSQNDQTKIKSAMASHSISLSSGGKLIASFTAKRKEYAGALGWGHEKLAPKSKIWENAKATGVLEATLRINTFSTHTFKPVLQNQNIEVAFASSPTAARLRGQATADLVNMLKSGNGGDVDIKVPKQAGGDVDETVYTRKVHKCILMARSSFFAEMFGEGSTMVEAKTGKIVIEELSPKGLIIFLRYLYTGEVLQAWVQVPEELLNAAGKYNCEELKSYFGHHFLDAVTTANAPKMYKVAKNHELTFAAKGVMEFIAKNMESVILQVADKETTK